MNKIKFIFKSALDAMIYLYYKLVYFITRKKWQIHGLYPKEA